MTANRDGRRKVNWLLVAAVVFVVGFWLDVALLVAKLT